MDNNRERRSRIRSSIRDYYDLQASPERQQQEKKAADEGSARHQDPNSLSPSAKAAALAAQQQAAALAAGQELNMDSDQFNSAQYTTKILKEKTLKQLYEKDTELRKKVRELDGDLQDLVYNNYTNFIAATDTIRDMRGNVEDMDHRLHALSTNVERIDDVSKTIRGKLEDHRGKIEEVLAVNKMLQKIKFLVALPEAMKKFVESGRYTTAAKYWFAGDAIFKKYSNIASFKATHQECREIAESCYLKLLDRVKTTDLEADKVEPIRADVEALRSLLPTSITITAHEEDGHPSAKKPKGAKAAVAPPSSPSGVSFDDDMLGLLFKHSKESFHKKVEAISASIETAFTKYSKDLTDEFSVEGVLSKKSKKPAALSGRLHRRTASGASDTEGDKDGDDDAEDQFEGPQADLAEAMEQLKDAVYCLSAHRLRARDIMMSEVPDNFPDLLMQDVFPVITKILRLISQKRGGCIEAAIKLLSASLAEIGTDGGAKTMAAIASAAEAAKNANAAAVGGGSKNKKHASHAASTLLNNTNKASAASAGGQAAPPSIQLVLSSKCDPSGKVDLLLTCIIRELRRFAQIPTKVLKLDQLVLVQHRHSSDSQQSPPPRCSYTDDAIHLAETLVKDEIRSSLIQTGESMAARASLDVKTLQQAKQIAVVAIIMKMAGKVVISNLRSALGGAAVETALKQALHSGSKTVCSVAIGQISGFVGSMLTDAVDSGRWNAKSTPAEVSAFLPIVVEELRSTEFLLHALAPGDSQRSGGSRGNGSTTGSGVSYGASNAGGRSTNSRTGAASTNTGGGSSNIPVVAGFTRREHKLSLAGNMDRLGGTNTAGNLNCLRPSTLDSSHILECITLAVLKCWTESARGGGNGGSEEDGGKVYNKGGFQQMQVDASYLLLALKEGAEQTSMAPSTTSTGPAMPVVPVAVGSTGGKKSDSSSANGVQRYPLLCHRDERLVEATTEMLCSVYERCSDKVALPPVEVEGVSRQAFATAK